MINRFITFVLSSALLSMSVPVLASVHTTDNTTSVSYILGGTIVDPEGKIMVEVPKNITLVKKNEEKQLKIQAKVWDADSGTWQTPSDTYPMDKQVRVFMQSDAANGSKFTLNNDAHEGISGKYQVAFGNNVFNTTTPDGSANTNENKGFCGDLMYFKTGEENPHSINPYITGKVKMTEEPKVGQNQVDITFTDTITFTFKCSAVPAS